MTVDWNKPIQTRDGRPARLLGKLANRSAYIVAVMEGDGCETCHQRCADGDFAFLDPNARIINVPEKRIAEYWLNVYASIPPKAHDTRDDADSYSGPNRIACLHIRHEYEEGDGL